VILEIDALALARGRSYLLSGGNGAGKTTLLRTLAGLDPADCELLRFDGRALVPGAYPRSLHRRIALVQHHPFLFGTSVAANVAYGLRAAGLGEAETGRRVAEAMRWAALGTLAATPPRALSAGEAQRVALARAHVLDPDLYLLDEPTANLDEDGRRLVIALIEGIVSEGKTLLIACHDRELLALPAVERLHIEAGRIART
jgi:tungstate transport system ATP-binding protein